MRVLSNGASRHTGRPLRTVSAVRASWQSAALASAHATAWNAARVERTGFLDNPVADEPVGVHPSDVDLAANVLGEADRSHYSGPFALQPPTDHYGVASFDGLISCCSRPGTARSSSLRSFRSAWGSCEGDPMAQCSPPEARTMWDRPRLLRACAGRALRRLNCVMSSATTFLQSGCCVAVVVGCQSGLHSHPHPGKQLRIASSSSSSALGFSWVSHVAATDSGRSGIFASRSNSRVKGTLFGNRNGEPPNRMTDMNSSSM